LRFFCLTQQQQHSAYHPLQLPRFLRHSPSTFLNMSGPPDSFTGDWITPGHSDYSKAIARWAANAERRAKVVAFVKSAQDVAVVLRYAKQQNLPLAVRGGGHSPAGASSIENGIVIDLSRHLSKVRVDPIAKLAYVCGGAIWETVDKTAIEHGLATVAGTINHVSNPDHHDGA
jgi:hypothetical protein